MAAAFQTAGSEIEMPSALDYLDQPLLELGSLVARLSEDTEDELELDLRVRTFVESGRVHLLQRLEPVALRSLGEASLLEN